MQPQDLGLSEDVVILPPNQWGAWLSGAEEADHLRPLPAGSLSVEKVA